MIQMTWVCVCVCACVIIMCIGMNQTHYISQLTWLTMDLLCTDVMMISFQHIPLMDCVIAMLPTRKLMQIYIQSIEFTASRYMPILFLFVSLFVWLVLPLCFVFFLCASKTLHFVVFQLVRCGHFHLNFFYYYYYYSQIDATEWNALIYFMWIRQKLT